MNTEDQAVAHSTSAPDASTRSTITTVAGVLWAVLTVAVIGGLTVAAVSLAGEMTSGRTGTEFAGLLFGILLIVGVPLAVGAGVATLLTWRASVAGHIVSLVLAAIAGTLLSGLLVTGGALLLVPVVLAVAGALVAGSISGIRTARARSAQP